MTIVLYCLSLVYFCVHLYPCPYRSIKKTVSVLHAMHYSVLYTQTCLVWSNTSSPTPDPVRSDLAEEQKDVLDRDKCLEALASLRHAKWFQVRLLLHVLLSILHRRRDVIWKTRISRIVKLFPMINFFLLTSNYGGKIN